MNSKPLPSSSPGNLLGKSIALLLVGAGLFFISDKVIEYYQNGRLKHFLEYAGYLSAPVGVASYFFGELREIAKENKRQIEELKQQTFIDINQLKIISEYSYRYGQQSADIENMKNQLQQLIEKSNEGN